MGNLIGKFLREGQELKVLKRIVPRKIQTLLRFYTIFNREYGHNSFKNGFCSDGKGNIVPWITYPCIEFLNTLDLQDCRVFEYGAGSSTHYWAKKVSFVAAVERDKEWYQRLYKDIPNNCEVRHCCDEVKYPGTIKEFGGLFDIIVLDGAIRYSCAEESLKKITPRGIIILDNTEWYPNTAKLLRDQGFAQIDFCGFPPINAFTSCTSIFFKSTELLNRKLLPQQWIPVGGRFLVAHDDIPLWKIDPLKLVRG